MLYLIWHLLTKAYLVAYPTTLFHDVLKCLPRLPAIETATFTNSVTVSVHKPFYKTILLVLSFDIISYQISEKNYNVGENP